MDLSMRGLAARQLADYRARTPGTFFAEEDRPSLSLEDAYAVQAGVAALRGAEGEPVAGYKVGCTGPNVREQFGMDGPIRGFVYGTSSILPERSCPTPRTRTSPSRGSWPSGSRTTPGSRASSRSSSCTTTSSAPRPRLCRS